MEAGIEVTITSVRCPRCGGTGQCPPVNPGDLAAAFDVMMDESKVNKKTDGQLAHALDFVLAAMLTPGFEKELVKEAARRLRTRKDKL